MLDCVIDRKVRDIIFEAILSPSERYQNIEDNPEYNSVLPFRIILKIFAVNMLIILFNRLILHNFAVFVAKNVLVFISYTFHRKKLIDMFINNINGVINKNVSLFFFPSDIKLAWKAKQKQQELTRNQLFLFLCFFIQKFRIKGNQKHQFLKGDSMKMFWVKC